MNVTVNEIGCKHFPVPQFSRLCAVFGGIYCLKRSITKIHCAKYDGKLVFDAIQCDAQKIYAKNIVFGNGSIASAKFEKAARSSNETVDSDAVKVGCGNLSRAIFITDTPIGDASLNSGGGGVIFLKIPSPNGDGDGAFVIQLAHWSGCCPNGLCKFTFVTILCPHNTTLHFHDRHHPHHLPVTRRIGKRRPSTVCGKVIQKLSLARTG